MYKIKLIIITFFCLYLGLINSASLEVKAEIDNAENLELIKALHQPTLEGAEKIDNNKLLDLIKNTKNINAQSNSGLTALHTAVINKNMEAIKLLIQHPDYDVNLEDNDGFTPLALAVKMEDVEIIKLLKTNKNINTNTRSFQGKKRFFEDLKKIKDLPLSSQENCDKINLAYKLTSIGGITPLMQAIQSKNIPIIALLFEMNANPCLTGILNPEQAFRENNIKEVTAKDLCNFECKELTQEIELYKEGAETFYNAISNNSDPEFLITYIQNYKIDFNVKFATQKHKTENYTEYLNNNGFSRPVQKQREVIDGIDYNSSIIAMLFFKLYNTPSLENYYSKIILTMLKKGLNSNALYYNIKLMEISYSNHITTGDRLHSILEFALSYTEIVKVLIESGANISYFDKGSSILDDALKIKSKSLALLIKAGAKHKTIKNKFA